MRRMMKMMTAALTLIMILAACGGNTKLANKEFRMAIDRVMTTLNHQTTTSRAEMEQISQVMEGLTRYDDQKKLAPAGAESWTISEDYLTYTFKLRKDAKWENGEPVTAKDYVFAWQTLITNPKAGYNYVLTILEHGAEVKQGSMAKTSLGVKALDDYTFEVKLISPYAPLLDAVSTVTYYPLNEAKYTEVGADNYGTTAASILTNGAFKLTTYEPASLLEYTKSENYWDAKAVNLNTVKVNVISEITTQSVMFDSGELDILRITGAITDKYPDNSDTINELESRIIFMYLSGTTGTPNALLSNRSFRQAIARLIDKELITNNLLKDGSAFLEGIIPAGFGDVKGRDFRSFTQSYNQKSIDIAESRKLFATAKNQLPENTPLVLNIAYQETGAFKKVFENIKSQIETALPEVVVVLESVPNQVYVSQAMKKQTPAGVGSWSAAFTDYFNFMELFADGATFNYGNYNNPEFESLVKRARIEGDLVRQAEIYAQAEKVLVEDAVYIPLYQVGAKYAIKPNIKGFLLNSVSPSIDFKFITVE
ncbi:MAG: peptide ABC transporter substrate-binding protein [Culicoidibacterales bacterium]